MYVLFARAYSFLIHFTRRGKGTFEKIGGKEWSGWERAFALLWIDSTRRKGYTKHGFFFSFFFFVRETSVKREITKFCTLVTKKMLVCNSSTLPSLDVQVRAFLRVSYLYLAPRDIYPSSSSPSIPFSFSLSITPPEILPAFRTFSWQASASLLTHRTCSLPLSVRCVVALASQSGAQQ